VQSAPDQRRALGRLGEELALAHLRALGATVVARNERTRAGEIDLIVRDGETLVFVEVKTRRLREPPPSCPANGPPADAPLLGLRAAQRRRLRRLAVAWLAEHPPTWRPTALRFDAIGVVIDTRDRLVRLDHLEGAL
jgi:putative endonuclease